MLTVYLYDGTPIDVYTVKDIPLNSTATPPPDGMYQPLQFDPDTETWSGGNPTQRPVIPATDDEDNENDEGDVGDVDLNEVDLLNMQLITNDIQHSKEIKSLESDIANLTKLLLMSQRG